MVDVQCDLCGSSFEWTRADVLFDRSLRFYGAGLGKMCGTCSAKEVAIMERMEAEALAELEDDEE